MSAVTFQVLPVGLGGSVDGWTTLETWASGGYDELQHKITTSRNVTLSMCLLMSIQCCSRLSEVVCMDVEPKRPTISCITLGKLPNFCMPPSPPFLKWTYWYELRSEQDRNIFMLCKHKGASSAILVWKETSVLMVNRGACRGHAWGRLRKESWVGPMTTPSLAIMVPGSTWPKGSQSIDLPVVKGLARNMPKWGTPGQSNSLSFSWGYTLMYQKGVSELMREADTELYREELKPRNYGIQKFLLLTWS